MTLFENLYERGHTVILVTHEADIANHARRTVRLRDGLIESDDGGFGGIENLPVEDPCRPMLPFTNEALFCTILVRERLVAGDSDEQVLAFVTERYGDFVLLKPPVKPATWLLWFGPPRCCWPAAACCSAYFRGRGAGRPRAGARRRRARAAAPAARATMRSGRP